MALSTSAYLSRSKYVVAIAGATGNLGSIVSKTILTEPYLTHFSRVSLLVRDPSSPAAQELKDLGGEPVKIDFDDATSLNDSLEGVDVLINVLGTTHHSAKDKLLTAALANDVLLYIPSEFGVDDRFNDFEHVEWDQKKHNVARARKEGGPKMKTVAIYIGLFLEHSIGPWFGFNTRNKVYTAVGSPDTLVTYTSKGDVARSVAQVVMQALGSPSTYPDDICIAGTLKSHTQVRDIISRESGEQIEVKSLGDVAAYKKELLEKSGPKENLPGYIRLLMAEGKLDFSKHNQNEMVNPEQKLWKWKTLEEYAKEVNGRPWIDI